MSIDYDFTPILGYKVSPKNLAKICTTRPKSSHMEDRYDEKTGKKTGQVEVIDSDESRVYKVGRDYTEEFSGACHLLAKKVGCNFEWCTDNYSDLEHGYFYINKLRRNDAAQYSDGRISVAAPTLVPKRANAKLAVLKKRLEARGIIGLGQPTIAVGMSIT